MRLLLAMLILLVGVSAQANEKPNIIIITTDDQHEALTMGSDPATGLPFLPNVKSLLTDKGVRFTNSFTDFPLCCPSRASFLLGQAAHNHGIKSNKTQDGGGWAAFQPMAGNSLSVWLKDAGYRTAMVGRFLNNYTSTEIPPGWDEWFAGMVLWYSDYDVNDNGSVVHYGNTEADYSTDVISKRVLELIGCRCNYPLFMWINVKSPHNDKANAPPASAPRHASLFPNLTVPQRAVNPAFNELDVSDKPSWIPQSQFGQAERDALHFRYKQAMRSLQSVDEMVGSIVQKLTQTGRLANTYICFTSDNGIFFGEHRLVDGKIYGYEPSLRVPLICRGPGIPEGETRTQLVTNLDLTATVIDWADATPGRTLDGKSLAPVLASSSEPWRSAFFFQGDVINCPTVECYSGVRTMTRKYMKYGDGFEELYDLALDPIENENKATDQGYAADLAVLRSIHETLKTCFGETCWVQ